MILLQSLFVFAYGLLHGGKLLLQFSILSDQRYSASKGNGDDHQPKCAARRGRVGIKLLSVLKAKSSIQDSLISLPNSQTASGMQWR